MKKTVILLTVLLLLVSGCSSGNNEPEKPDNPPATEEKYTIVLNGKEITAGDKFDENNFPPCDESFDETDCAFGDKVTYYEYGDYEVMVCYINGEAYIYEVFLLSPDIKTKEGLALGDSYDDMIKAMGEPVRTEDITYYYQKGKTVYAFVVADGSISTISYSLER
ncbi:MAG: hypothetical protein K6A14_04640 [Erysipelotrichaceae bacterium]|nr:hypothetical protein [Erysipelotrichaceae bacterium]